MPKVTLLLGAGASVEAGLPTMAGVLESFARSVEGEPRLASALSCVIASLRSHSEAARHRPVLDLELLIEALEFLEQRDGSIAAAFVHQWRGGIKKHLGAIPDLRRRLHAHLRNELDVDPSRVEYLMPLADFAREQGGIDVFTLNYDAAIEVVADRSGILYTDGFDSHWNPSLFDQVDRYPIRLFKLHGSLLWYETGSPGRFAKIALRPRDFPESGSHISGESLASLLIYPGPNKEMYAEPYASLLERFRSALRDTTVLVVIGCSLRDAHVRQAVLEAMSASDEFRVVVIDPSAGKVLGSSDLLYADGPQFKQFLDQLIQEPRPAGEALAERLPLRAVAGCSVVSEEQGEFDRSKRTEAHTAQASHLANLLAVAAEHQHWGKLTALLKREDPTVASSAVEELARSGGSPGAVGSPRFVAMVLASARVESEGREGACARIREAMVGLAGYGWTRSNGNLRLVIPGGMSVATMSRATRRGKMEGLFRSRLDAVRAARSMLDGALEGASFSLDASDIQALREIQRQVGAIAEYFEAASGAPEYAGVPGHNQDPIPAGPREARERLAEALSNNLGVVGACRTCDLTDPKN